MGERVSWPLVATLLFIGIILGGCAMLVVQQRPASATTTTTTTPTPCPRPALHTCIEPVKYPGTSPRPSASVLPMAPSAAPTVAPVRLATTGGYAP